MSGKRSSPQKIPTENNDQKDGDARGFGARELGIGARPDQDQGQHRDHKAEIFQRQPKRRDADQDDDQRSQMQTREVLAIPKQRGHAQRQAEKASKPPSRVGK